MSEWISVKDRLPSNEPPISLNHGAVIVTDGSEVWEEFTSNVKSGADSLEITHWMPLPDPPAA